MIESASVEWVEPKEVDSEGVELETWAIAGDGFIELSAMSH
jgi:hypothetical protein